MLSQEVYVNNLKRIKIFRNQRKHNQNRKKTKCKRKAEGEVKAPGTDELFEINPHAGNSNPSSGEGWKFHLKETDELPEDQKIKESIENGLKVRDALEKNRSEFSWSSLLSRT